MVTLGLSYAVNGTYVEARGIAQKGEECYGSSVLCFSWEMIDAEIGLFMGNCSLLLMRARNSYWGAMFNGS